jgi:peroxiredoxin
MTKPSAFGSYAVLSGILLVSLTLPAAAQNSGQGKTDSEQRAQPVITFRALVAEGLSVDQSALEILHHTAKTYRKSGESEFNITLQKLENGGEKVSERSAVRRPGFDQIDQHVRSALIAREERYILQGKPVAIVIVRVMRDEWPEGTLPGAQFAMYRIDQKTFKVYKVSTYAGSTTEIAFYGGESPAPGMNGEGVSMIGMEAPDFTLSDPSGQTVHLRDLRGKVVVVDFWATWCGPCRELMPHIQKMHEQLAAQGLTILGLDVGEEADRVAMFAKQQSYTFRLLLDAEPQVTSRYFVTALPTTFVIDRAGRIAFRGMGLDNPAEFQAAVENALSKD